MIQYVVVNATGVVFPQRDMDHDVVRAAREFDPAAGGLLNAVYRDARSNDCAC